MPRRIVQDCRTCYGEIERKRMSSTRFGIPRVSTNRAMRKKKLIMKQMIEEIHGLSNKFVIMYYTSANLMSVMLDMKLCMSF